MQKKNILILLLLVSLSEKYAQAVEFFNHDFGCFGVEVRGGVAPVLFSNKQETFTVVQNVSEQEGRLDKLFDAFKFSKMFKTPWIVAGQFNWSINECHTLFVELNYTRANGKTFTTDFSLRNAQEGETTGQLQLGFGDFSMFGAYLGHRCYWDFSDCAALYGGSKFGLGHYKNISLNIIRTEPNPNVYDVTNTAYEKQTVVSGGLQIGFDYSFTECASFIIQAEVVASGALSNSIDKFVFDPSISVAQASNNIIGKTGTLVSFPVTFGFSYNW